MLRRSTVPGLGAMAARSPRRVMALLLLVTALLVSFATVASAAGLSTRGTGTSALAACNDTWLNPAGGNWSVAGNWSAGAPTSSRRSASHLPGTYTVELATARDGSTSFTIGGAVSGTQTLQIDGGATTPAALNGTTDNLAGGRRSSTTGAFVL